MIAESHLLDEGDFDFIHGISMARSIGNAREHAGKLIADALASRWSVSDGYSVIPDYRCIRGWLRHSGVHRFTMDGGIIPGLMKDVGHRRTHVLVVDAQSIDDAASMASFETMARYGRSYDIHILLVGSNADIDGVIGLDWNEILSKAFVRII